MTYPYLVVRSPFLHYYEGSVIVDPTTVIAILSTAFAQDVRVVTPVGEMLFTKPEEA